MGELKQLTIDYAKQETVDPVKRLGSYLVMGVLGSVLMGVGLVLWIVALLRALQNETGTTFTDNLSWLPYLITLVFCVAVIAVAGYAIGKDKRRADRRKSEHDAMKAAKSV